MPDALSPAVAVQAPVVKVSGLAIDFRTEDGIEQVIKDVLLEAQPTKEFVTSEQVAALALFLCSDDAAQITGANLSIDGGWTAA